MGCRKEKRKRRGISGLPAATPYVHREMFKDSFLANLLILLVAQLVAYGYLRTGLLRRGVLLMVGTWVMADVALLARFAFAYTGPWYLAALLLMQLHAVLEAFLYASGRVRRRFGATTRRRKDLYFRAFRHYLRNELDQAQTILRRLVRWDPWDLESTLALATVLSRKGRHRRARGLLRQARGLDRQRRFRDVIGAELRHFKVRRRPVPVTSGRLPPPGNRAW